MTYTKTSHDIQGPSNSSGTTTPQTLPLPIPLRVTKKQEQEEFPLDALIDVLRWAVEAIVDRTDVPYEIAAMSVLSVASLAAQTIANVKSPKGHIDPLSLFVITVGKSGERKSSSDKLAMAPVRLFEQQLEISYNNRMKHYRDEFSAWSASYKAISSKSNISMQEKLAELAKLGPEPVRPLLPQLTCSEPTIEGLLTLFYNGYPSLGIFSDEGSTFVGGYALSDEARLRTGAALCKFWDGDSVDRTRKLQEESYRLKNRRLAMHLMVQPSIVEDFLALKELQGLGLFSRCLIAFPESNIGKRFQHGEDSHTEEKLRYFNQRLVSVFQTQLSLVPGTRNELMPTILQLDEAAQERWAMFADYVEAEQSHGGDYQSIQGFASKMLANALRIAGVMTIVQNPHATVITEDMLIKSGCIMHYFAAEQLRIFDESDVDEDTRNAQLLLDWLRDQYEEEFVSMTEIQREGPRKFRDTKLALKNVQRLVDHNYLMPAPANTHIRGRKIRTRAFYIQR